MPKVRVELSLSFPKRSSAIAVVFVEASREALLKEATNKFKLKTKDVAKAVLFSFNAEGYPVELADAGLLHNGDVIVVTAGERPARLPTWKVQTSAQDAEDLGSHRESCKSVGGVEEQMQRFQALAADVACPKSADKVHPAVVADLGGSGAAGVDGEKCEEECRDPAAELTPYLCLGGLQAAQHLPHLQSLGVTHVLNVADDVACFFPEELTYLHRAIADGGHDDSIVDVFEEAAVFVREVSGRGGRVFVHCYAGVNRSATVAMAVLMQLEGWSLQRAYDHIDEHRAICPMVGNREKVARWELQTRGECTVEDWLGEGCDRHQYW